MWKRLNQRNEKSRYKQFIKHRLTDCDCVDVFSCVHKHSIALSITQIHYRYVAKREKAPVIDKTIDRRCIDNSTSQRT